MSTFKQRLNELFASEYEGKEPTHEYGSRTDRTKRATPSHKSQAQNIISFNKPSDLNEAFLYKKDKANTSFQTTTTTHNRQQTSQSAMKKRKRSIDILNTSNLSSSRYTERPSFSPNPNHFTQYRDQSRNKTQTRIKKKIADLSKDFKEVIHPGHLNRPITSLDKINPNSFNINLITLSSLKSTYNKKPSKTPAASIVNPPQPNQLNLRVPFATQKDKSKGDVSSYASTFRAKNGEQNTLKQLYELIAKNKVKY